MKYSFGYLPVCKDYKKYNVNQERFELVIKENKSGLVHIENPVKVSKLISRFNWLKETEPKDQLNVVAKIIECDIKKERGYIV